MLNNNLSDQINMEVPSDGAPRPNQEVTQRTSVDQGTTVTERSKAYFAEKKERRKEKLRPRLKDLRASLLTFMATDKLVCTLALVALMVTLILYVNSIKVGEEGWMSCIEKSAGKAMFTKEQVILAAVVAGLLLLNCVYTFVVMTQFRNAILQKQLGFLKWQRSYGLFVLSVKMILVFAWYMQFDYNPKVIMVSLLPLTYHCISLIHLVKYISEIKIANSMVNVNFPMKFTPTNTSGRVSTIKT